jgi:hypothetical protein
MTDAGPDRDHSSPPPETASGAEPPAEEKRKGLWVSLLGGIGCLGIAFAFGGFILAAIIVYLLVRGWAGGDVPITPETGTPPPVGSRP